MIRKILRAYKSLSVVIPKEFSNALQLNVGTYLDFKLVGNRDWELIDAVRLLFFLLQTNYIE